MFFVGYEMTIVICM